MPQSKTANGTGSIRKKTVMRDNKTYEYWEARYTTGFDFGTGKQIQKSVTGKTKTEVAQKLRKVTSEIDNGLYQDPSKISLGEWLDTWVHDYLGGVKESSAYHYECVVRLHLKPNLAALCLKDLTPQMIQMLYNKLGRKTEKGKALSAKYIKDIHGVLHCALSQAQRVGYLKENPTEGCILPKYRRKQIVPLNELQIKSFLQTISSHCHEQLYKTALFTGMREGEILGLQWNCIDFDSGLILIDKQLQRDRKKGGKYHFCEPKNGKSRHIMVAPSVLHILRQQKTKQDDLKEAAGVLWVDSGLVFTNEIGDRLSYRTVYDCFKRIVERLGFPGARFHDLRHTYAVAALESGDDVKTVQENLGHHSASFTLDVYGHVSDRMRSRSAARMESFILEHLPDAS